MNRFFVAILFGLTVAMLSTSASAWECMARSSNGAVGGGSGIILERAQGFAMRRCVAAGGNLQGNVCQIVYCR